MKTRSLGNQHGFTLIELLTVIAIIGILAGMLLPAISAVQGKAKKAQCQKDIAELEGAINAYNADNSRLPVTSETRKLHAQAIDSVPDLRFGTNGAPPVPATAAQSLFGNPPPVTVQPNNAEIIAILMNLTNVVVTYNSSGGVPVNYGFSLNPKHQAYFNPKQLGGPGPGGVDLSAASLTPGSPNQAGLFRDPWGHPYYIVLDMDYDGRCLSPFPDIVAGAPKPKYINRPVLIFSGGPDGQFDLNAAQTDKKTRNADNVYSW